MKPTGSFFGKFIITLITACFCNMACGKDIKISGVVTDSISGEPLPGVVVFESTSGKGAATSVAGEFTLQVEEGNVSLRFTYLGYTAKQHSFFVLHDTLVTVRLAEKVSSTREVQVTALRPVIKGGNAPGAMSITGGNLNQIPAFGGEKDIVGLFMLMPGIKKAGDANGGMLVRGGNADQNQVLLNGVPLYQAGHIISFYSPFQPELISEATLYKGNMPAQFGGRLSSVLDVKSSQKDCDSLTGSVMLGMVLGKFHLEGPAFNKKVHFSAGLRRSLPDLIWPAAGQSFPASFYDGQANINFTAGKHHRFSLNYFNSLDALDANGSSISKVKANEKRLDPALNMLSRINQQNLSAHWAYKKTGSRVACNALVYYSDYNNKNTISWPGNSLSVSSGIRDFGYSASSVFDWNVRHTSFFSAGGVHHVFSMGEITSTGEANDAFPSRKALATVFDEFYTSASHQWLISSNLKLDAGIRISGMLNDAAAQLRAEPRLYAQYELTNEHSFFGGVQRTAQYLHKVSNSATALPTDTWLASGNGLLPQTCWQYSAGWRMKKNKITTEAEVYYRDMQNQTEFKEGALPLKSANIYNDIVQGTGRAYGLESMLRYDGKKTSLWVSYTLSWSDRHFNQLNNAKTFYSRFDRRHDLSISARYNLSTRLTFTAVFNIASGARFTPRSGNFLMPGVQEPGVDLLPIFGGRNSYRLSAVHRLDIGLTYTTQWRGKSVEWQAGAYNVYNQVQPFRLEILEKGGKLVFREIGLFGFVPSFSATIKF